MRGTSFILIMLFSALLFGAGKSASVTSQDDKPIVFEPSRSTVVLNTTLTDGRFKEGFGIIISDTGLVLTNANNVYDKEEESYAESILLKVQDTDYNPISCFAKMRIGVVDLDRNLAILSVDKYTNVYCDAIMETNYYNVSFLKNHTINILNINDKKLGIQYPKLGSDIFVSYLSSRERILLQSSIAVEYDYIEKNHLKYLSSFTVDKLNSDVRNGSAVYDDRGDFLGLLTLPRRQKRSTNGVYKNIYYARVISTGIITGFLCNSAKKGFVNLKVHYKNKIINIVDHPICKIILSKEKIYSQKDWNL